MGAAPGPQEKGVLESSVPGHNQHKCASMGDKSGNLRCQSVINRATSLEGDQGSRISPCLCVIGSNAATHFYIE